MINGIKDMTLYDSLKCHDSQIQDFDIHESGRLIVSIGFDKKLKLWNLMDMKEAYHKNLWKVVDFVRFVEGADLALGYDKEVVIFKTEDNSISAVVDHEARLTWIQYDSERKLLFSSGTKNSKNDENFDFSLFSNFIQFLDDLGWIYIRKYENRSDMGCIKFQAYDDKRVKSFDVKFSKHTDSVILTTISTEGFITVFDISVLLENLEDLDHKVMDIGRNFEPVYSINISSRLISLATKLNFVAGKANLGKRGQPEASTTLSAARKQKLRTAKRLKHAELDHHHHTRDDVDSVGVLSFPNRFKFLSGLEKIRLFRTKAFSRRKQG